MLKKPIALERRSVPLTATSVDITVTHGPQKGKTTTRAAPTQDRLFWGRARDRTVARKYPIRKAATLQGRNNSVSDFPSFITFSLRGYLQACATIFGPDVFHIPLTPGVG